jgi:hypothetical protein
MNAWSARPVRNYRTYCEIYRTVADVIGMTASGQNRKSSVRAYVFRCAAESGHSAGRRPRSPEKWEPAKRNPRRVSKRHVKQSVFLPNSTKEGKLVLRRRRDPAAARGRETELGCNAHHDLRLPVGDRKIWRLYRKPGGRFHHGPILLNLLHRFGPHPISPAVGRKGSPIEIGYQIKLC